MNDLVNLLIDNLDGRLVKSLSKKAHFECSQPTKKGHRCTTCLNCLFFDLLSRFSQQNIDAIIACGFLYFLILDLITYFRFARNS